MKNNRIYQLVLAAVLAAAVCVATVVLVVPLPGNGYANLGDAVIILSAALLNPWWGAAAAGLGAALGDLFLGYVVYAPATFVIKAVMALCVSLLFSRFKAPAWLRVPLAVIAAEAVMIGGYFLFELCLYGPTVAVPDLLGNGTQGLVGAVLGAVLLTVVNGSRRMRGLKNRKK